VGLFIPPPVTVDELIDFMTGDVPVSQEPHAQPKLTPEGEDYRFDFPPSTTGERLTLWLGGRDLETRRALWLDATGQPLYQVEFQEFTLQANQPRPQLVNLTSGPEQNRIKLHYQDFTPNPPQIDGLLNLPGSEGLVEVPLPQ
jgi:hypothetical protein